VPGNIDSTYTRRPARETIITDIVKTVSISIKINTG
jgi:hypothetical protein